MLEVLVKNFNALVKMLSFSEFTGNAQILTQNV